MDQMIVSCSVVANDDNKHMGGVHRADSLSAVYELDCHSKKWQHRLC
jgi:hypothetical protein